MFLLTQVEERDDDGDHLGVRKSRSVDSVFQGVILQHLVDYQINEEESFLGHEGLVQLVKVQIELLQQSRVVQKIESSILEQLVSLVDADSIVYRSLNIWPGISCICGCVGACASSSTRLGGGINDD